MWRALLGEEKIALLWLKNGLWNPAFTSNLDQANWSWVEFSSLLFHVKSKSKGAWLEQSWIRPWLSSQENWVASRSASLSRAQRGVGWHLAVMSQLTGSWASGLGGGKTGQLSSAPSLCTGRNQSIPCSNSELHQKWAKPTPRSAAQINLVFPDLQATKSMLAAAVGIFPL